MYSSWDGLNDQLQQSSIGWGGAEKEKEREWGGEGEGEGDDCISSEDKFQDSTEDNTPTNFLNIFER